jgi:dihydroneopterin triphosphate diphosphatase
MNTELPIKIELIVYRHTDDDPLFLLLKRSPEDGGFWQPITGTLEMNESIIDCIVREQEEETGLINPFLSPQEVYSFTWMKDSQTILELVFMAEAESDMVRLSKEHTEYRWCSYDDALSLLRYESNRTAVSRANELYQKTSSA